MSRAAPAVVFLLALFSIRLVAIHNQVSVAAGDARKFHFPVINYFIQHGFDWHYPVGIAMLPGMHMAFATVARLVGLGHLAPEDWAAFAIQSVVGIGFLVFMTKAFFSATADRPDARPWLFVPLLVSSRYPIESWVWPTTDLGSFAAYAALLCVMQRWVARRTVPTWGEAALCAAIVLLGGAWRQSFAPLGFAVGLAVVANLPVRSWLRASVVARLVLPAAAGVAIIGICWWAWHGMVPPSFGRHTDGGLDLVAVAHIVALTGLIGWPFALIAARELADRAGGWRSRGLWQVAAASLVIGVAIPLCLPTAPGYDAGRALSLVWTIQERLHVALVRFAFMAGISSVGAFVWLSVARLAIRNRVLDAELALILVFAASQALQHYSWQRYVEWQMLLTLILFFARHYRLTRFEGSLVFGWGAVYLLFNVLRVVAGYT